MGVLPACIVCLWAGDHGDQKRTMGLLDLELTDGHELPYGWWRLNSGPLAEQPVFLTAEPSLQLLCRPPPPFILSLSF